MTARRPRNMNPAGTRDRIIIDTRTISFAYSYNKMQFCNYISDLVSNGSSTGVASYYQKSLKLATKTLEKLVKAFEG